MATTTIAQDAQRPAPTGQARGSVRYDWLMAGLGTWLLAGGYSDGWAHNHLPLDNFFTPWHGAFYSGFLAAAVFVGATFLMNRRKGYAWYQAMPAGYELSLVGIMIVFFGGFGDMIWHTLFGIEKNVDGLLSPTHIALIIGLGLVVSGPYRAAWQRTTNAGAKKRLIDYLPMLLSLTFLFSLFTLITQLFHPFVIIAGVTNTFASQEIGAVSIVLQTVIAMALILLTIRRWGTLPFGSLTLFFTLNMVLLSFMQDHYVLIPVVALAGLIADILAWRLQPNVRQPGKLRLFAFAVPVILYLLYFLTVELTMGITWSIHLWLGSIFVAGVIGCLLSYLVVPPALPLEETK